MKDRIVLLGIAGLVAVATAGWVRQPNIAPAVPVATDMQLEEVTTQSHVPVQTAVSAAAMQSRPVQVARASYRVNDRSRVVADGRPVMVQKARSKKASAAIIGGGAAAGAAIGGLAGGGKGAVIGAVAGGAGGLVYDRMTHKKSVPAEVPAREEQERYRRSGDYSDESDEDVARGTRSTVKSAAIIGGSAAAGAAIGAATGGGKGAAIGAIAGGAGGLIYDRATRNK